MENAVVYLRRSSTKQEKSISDQRTHVEKYAREKGFRIVGEYVDDGISGDNNAARDAFQKMRSDLTEGEVEASVILVWAYDRISRNDSDEESAAMFPLRQAGVSVHSVTEGRIDRDSFEGRLTHVVRQEGRHNFLRDLAKNSLRGRLNTAKLGRLAGQAAPYGFDRMVMSADGEQVLRIKNGDPKPTRGGSTYVTLVPSDDPKVVSTLQRIFQEFLKPESGLRTIADKLNRENIPGPRGGVWYPNTIRAFLTNEAYVGTFTFAKRTEAKFFQVAGDDIKERSASDRRSAKVQKNTDSVRVPNAFPALIDMKTWKAVQEKISGRNRKENRGRKPKVYALSGIVHCGCCGGAMTGAFKTRKKNGKTYEYSRYVCSTYLKMGSKNKFHAGCYHCQIDAGHLLNIVTDKLRNELLKPSNLKRIESSIRAQMQDGSSVKDEEKRLKVEIRTLSGKIDLLADRMIRDDDLFDILTPKLKALKADRDRASDRLSAVQAVSGVHDVESVIKERMAALQKFSELIQSSDPATRQHVISSLVSKVTLNFQQSTQGGREFSRFAGGVIELCNEKNRDDKI